MSVRDTDAWKAAEWDYSELHARQMMPLPGMTLSEDAINDRMDEIVRNCPQFYPAVLHRATRGLVAGESGADEQIVDGLRLLLEHGVPEDHEDEIDILIENLEKVYRFDVARRCLELLVELFPDKALFHDYLGYAAAGMGDIEAALQQGTKAVAMAPTNLHFTSNLGLFHLMAGNLDEAATYLNAALELDPENEVAKGNLQIHAYATEHGGSFFDYFLRPPDREEIERLTDEDAIEELDGLCESYNRDRIEAFGQSMASDERQRLRCASLLATLRSFFDFVHRISQTVGVLDEDVAFIHSNFDPIMHKFIFKFGDADRQMIEEICESLIEYYGFLSREKLVPIEEFRQFRNMVHSRRKEFVEKAQRYGEVRHNERMTADEKEAVREQLFEGDHCWPHL